MMLKLFIKKDIMAKNSLKKIIKKNTKTGLCLTKFNQIVNIYSHMRWCYYIFSY
uniref:Uncharacterized protein n=1 Tax=Anguilla anguilla TaxID=7936 RepID=A0A0E9PGI8_ANGAN